MLSQKKTVRALGLCSGGLDSILSGVVLRAQGIETFWISFETPFFSADKAKKASQMTGIPLIIQNITPQYLEMLRNPRCGYGKNMNPCLDCHALMFRIAGGIMREKGFDFLFSGEVMGQRPMSQTRNSLRYVEKNSGFEGYIVRPLSIQHLPETIAEKQGWIDRDSLYGIAGRGRKIQMELAEKFGIKEYPTVAGGCLLTDKNFSLRLKDLFRHQEIISEAELHLLKYGRHFRISPECKIIAGRHKADNEALLRHYRPDRDAMFKTVSVPGPVVLIPNSGTQDMLALAASVCAGYSKSPADAETEVRITLPEGQHTIMAKGIRPQELQPYLIGGV